MIQWLKQIDLTTVALVLGPILMVIALWSFRSRLWGSRLEEICVIVQKDHEILKDIEQSQREILDRFKNLKQ